MRKAFAVPAVAIAAAAFPLLTMSAASAADGSYQADLGALNESGVSGTGMVTLEGNQATVMIDASGLLEGAPHAQHFHIGAEGTCPTDANAADDEDDGFLSVTEGAPFYGAIGTSLTLEGDTSPDSGLAVDRFPTTGDLTYERTFEVTPDVAAAFEAGTAVLVLHGVDKDGSGTYDGDVVSDLDPSLPMEATAPAACGSFAASQMGTAPGGGAETGAGGTAGVEEQAAIAVGSLALVGAAAAGAVAYRRRQADSV